MKRSRLKNIINKSKSVSNKQEVGNPFDKFKKSLPIEVDDNYRLESAWKAYGKPKDYKEALWQGLIQPIDEDNIKLPSIGYNEETDEYEYLNKGRENEAVAKDIRVWDNDVIPLVKELKQGGFIRIYDDEKDCWKYSKNKPQEALNSELINYFKEGGPTKYTNGLKCETGECALFSNGELRNSGYMTRGNAWNLQDVDLLYSGYNTDNYPQTYNLLDVINYNNEASNNFYKNFDSKTLDKDSAYIVNMYYQGSPAQERAYNEGRDKMTGTHTGYVTWNPDTNRWEVTHNIHGTIHVDPFTLIQGGNKKYGITGIFTPRKNNIFNQLRSVLGLGEGGIIESEEVIDSFRKGGKIKVQMADGSGTIEIDYPDKDLKAGRKPVGEKNGKKLYLNGEGKVGYAENTTLNPELTLWLLKGGKPKFEDWYKTVPKEKSDTTNYDLEKAYIELPFEELELFRTIPEKHLDGRFKKPNHPTWDANQDPDFKGRYGWFGNDEDGWEFHPSPVQLKIHDADWYKQYWDLYEPESTLVIGEYGKPAAWSYNRMSREERLRRFLERMQKKYNSYTEQQPNSLYVASKYVSPEVFKQGGQMNVIPEGALHARKNNMEGAGEDFTAKGIPVVDNDGELVAEIEKNEIVFNKEVTDFIEENYNKFYSDEVSSYEKDELAIKVGKRLVKEILDNTDDRTGLIKEVADKNNLEYNK